MNITALYALFKSSGGIATDTRNTLSKKIYFALKGDHFDGNDFALDALSKGAIAAVVDRSYRLSMVSPSASAKFWSKL